MKPIALGLLTIISMVALGPSGAVGSAAQTGLAVVGGTSPFTLANSYTVKSFAIPANSSGPWSISSDRGGKIWFLEQTANALGSFDPISGTFEQFQIPTPRSTPLGLVVDDYGNVWFSELSSSKVAELPRGGSSVIERSVPGNLSCGPGAMVADSTGSIWFACIFSNQIDEYIPGNHSFASYDLPFFPSGPAGLALDGRGNLWFTAATSNMLGKVVISQLRNGTSEGITEFAPLNRTYVFTFSEQTSLLGGTATLRSSLPTPSGIGIDSRGTLWISEHSDSSFDSYDPSTGSLVRYWTAQTSGAYGFKVSFPNGIAVDKNNRVWIAEHYGNRVGVFDPTTDQLTEYPVSGTTFEGVYQLTLGVNDTPWFVEIQGNAIGELVPRTDPSPLTLTTPRLSAVIGQDASTSVPLTFTLPVNASAPLRLSLSVSGVSRTGVPQNMSADFSPSELTISPGATTTSNLTLATRGLADGIYYLSVTAASSSPDVLHSVIFKLTVSSGSQGWLIPALVGAVSIGVGSLIYWAVGRNSPRRFHRK